MFKLGVVGGFALTLRHSDFPNMLFVRYLSNAGRPRVESEQTCLYYSVLSPSDIQQVRCWVLGVGCVMEERAVTHIILPIIEWR